MWPYERTHGIGKIETPNLNKNLERNIKAARLNLYHQHRNGVYDPVTYYHVLDGLMQIVPGTIFRSKDFVAELNDKCPMMSWDPTTVGRVISDIAEATFNAYEWKLIGLNRKANGMSFDISGHPEARVILENLLTDLRRLSEAVIEEERFQQKPAKRWRSPLDECATVMNPVRQALDAS